MRKQGALAKKVAMAAGPFTLRGRIPRGKARLERHAAVAHVQDELWAVVP